MQDWGICGTEDFERNCCRIPDTSSCVKSGTVRSELLKPHHITNNYKKLKEEMEPNAMMDYLVQQGILNTDEDTNLLGQCRAKKSDVILRKLIESPNKLSNLMDTFKTVDAFQCFRSLTNNTSLLRNNPRIEVKETDAHVFMQHLQSRAFRERLLDAIRKHINNYVANNIVDDFLQEELITVHEHEEISSLENRTDAASKLIDYSKKNITILGSKKFLSILKYYEIDDLSCNQDIEKEESTGTLTSPIFVILNGKMYQGTLDKETSVEETRIDEVELRIIVIDGKKSLYLSLTPVPDELQEILLQKVHASIKHTCQGSLIIVLRSETSDTVTKLRTFIENGDMSLFLAELFKTANAQKLFMNPEQKIEIQIRKVKGFESQGLPEPVLHDISFKARLEQCQKFLSEELEPEHLLQNEKLDSIFEPVRGAVRKMTNRRAKIDVILKHLKEQSEENIELVLKTYREGSVIHKNLFPNTEEFLYSDIEQVKRNILDNIPELLDEINIDAIQTPFLSTGVVSLQELDFMRTNSASTREETLQFIKMVLHKGVGAIRIFLSALKISFGDTIIERLLKTAKLDDRSTGKNEIDKIEYKAFDEDSGLLFTGIFCLKIEKGGAEEDEKDPLGVQSLSDIRRRIRSVEKELDSTPMSVLTQNLISEKKQEISYLNQQLHRLRFETTALNCKGALAELQLKVDKLESDIHQKETELERGSQVSASVLSDTEKEGFPSEKEDDEEKELESARRMHREPRNVLENKLNKKEKIPLSETGVSTTFHNRWIAAIDFGTTFSGYAFGSREELENDPTKIFTPVWQAADGGLISSKTPTTILLDNDEKLVEFGFDAETAYSELSENGEHEDHYYFRRFKMMLYNKIRSSKLTIDSKISDIRGRKLKALTVFSHAIRYLKDHLLRSVKHRGGSIVKQEEILWVLTVPAIWDDTAKLFMRQAAQEAGIPGHQLMIALEPEAASIYCQHLAVKKLEGSNYFSAFQPGSKYLVLDAGGGTVDLTVHEIEKDRHLKELYLAHGGDWGGTSVDNAFKQALAEIVTEEMMQSYCQEYPGDYLELLREFEIKKRIYERENDSNIVLKFPITFMKECTKRLGTDLPTLIQKSRFNNHFRWRVGKVRIDMPTFKAFFQPACDGIINHVKKLLASSKVKNVRKILMVGGFSESPLLQDAIRKAFPDCQVMVPLESGLAILRGAAVFGYIPNIVKCRIARRTYGVKMNIEFDPEKHMESKKQVIDGVEYCKDIFDKHIEKGQELKLGEAQVERFYVPLTSDQTELTFILYCSEEQNPLYVDNCMKLGDLLLPVPKDQQDRSVEVHIIYANTELQVFARVIQTGVISNVTIDVLQSG